MASINELMGRLMALERQNRKSSGPIQPAFGGGDAPVQIGFPAKTTAVYDATLGYAWEQLVLSGSTITTMTLPRTGNGAFTVDNDQSLAVGTRGWLEIDPQAGGWLFTPARAGMSPLTTKGDVWGYSTVNARVPIGTNGHVLTADSAQTLGLKWAAPTGSTSPLTTKGDVWGYSSVDARVPVGTNDYVLTAASGETLGVKWAASGVGTTSPGWVKFTKTYTDLAAAATTNSITLTTLPARGIVHDCYVNHTVQFAGPGITGYTVTVGISGSLSKYQSSYTVSAAVPTSGPFTTISIARVMESGFATTDILLTGGAPVNLDNATAGSVDVYLMMSVLP